MDLISQGRGSVPTHTARARRAVHHLARRLLNRVGWEWDPTFPRPHRNSPRHASHHASAFRTRVPSVTDTATTGRADLHVGDVAVLYRVTPFLSQGEPLDADLAAGIRFEVLIQIALAVLAYAADTRSPPLRYHGTNQLLDGMPPH
ncbi:hypothetical protein ZWY2020_044268 [Hordeum vulgare]|nr:hypothetical protein ZWY2020_044268 [Hordeum vulgare]